MRKNAPVSPDGGAPTDPARPLPTLRIALILALMPLAYDAVSLCAAKWCALIGDRRPVDTPTLDALRAVADVVVGAISSAVAAPFRGEPWGVEKVVTVATIGAVAGAMILRSRSH